VRWKEAFYARAAAEQARVLGCECVVVPGHHQGFECEAEEFAPVLLEMLEGLGRKEVVVVEGRESA
jgi:hypothetical protein